jgi:hypothetical protein
MKRGLDGDPPHRAPASPTQSINSRDVAAQPSGRCFGFGFGFGFGSAANRDRGVT